MALLGRIKKRDTSTCGLNPRDSGISKQSIETTYPYCKSYTNGKINKIPQWFHFI